MQYSNEFKASNIRNKEDEETHGRVERPKLRECVSRTSRNERF